MKIQRSINMKQNKLANRRPILISTSSNGSGSGVKLFRKIEARSKQCAKHSIESSSSNQKNDKSLTYQNQTDNKNTNLNVKKLFII